MPHGDDDPDADAGAEEPEPCLQGRKSEPTPAELLQQPGEQAGDQRWDQGIEYGRDTGGDAHRPGATVGKPGNR